MNMKQVLTFSLILIAGLIYGQAKFLSDAGIAISVGDFQEAEKAILKAQDAISQKQIANEEVDSKDLRKFWKQKSHIYIRLATNQKDSILKLTQLETSKQAGLTYFDVDKTKYFEEEVKDDLKALNTEYYNIGVEHFNAKKFDKALTMFENVTTINKVLGLNDYRALQNVAYAALYSENCSKAIPVFTLLIDSKYNGQHNLQSYKKELIRCYSKEGKKEIALEKLKEFNTGDSIDVEMLKEELVLLIELKRTKEAIVKMDQIVPLAKEDALTLENIGKLYDQAGEKEKSLLSYKSALAIDATRPDSYYGIGKIMCDEFNNINKEINALEKSNEGMRTLHGTKNQDEITSNNKLIDEKQKMAEQKAQESASYIEKALEYAPNDQQVLDLLLQIYQNLGQSEKATAIKSRMTK